MKRHQLLRFAPLFLLAIGARPAFADRGIAYASITDGVTATVSQRFSLNPGGGPITAQRTGTGTYTVTFPNSGIGGGWAVLAASAGNNANYCNVTAWFTNQVFVQCFAPGGVLTDSPFTVTAFSQTNDKNIAFAWADQQSAASYNPIGSYSYNPAGGITITRQGTGSYNVNFSALPGAGGTVQLDVYGSSASCQSFGWSSGFDANVGCVNTAGQPVDTRFVIAIVPGGVTPPGVAFTWADQLAAASYTPNALYNYNPTGRPVNVTRLSPGQYVVTYAGLNLAQVNGGNVLATANGNPKRCKAASWGDGGGSMFQVMVNCYNLFGDFSDAQFEILSLPPMGYAYAFIDDGTTANVPAAYAINPGGGAVTAVRNSKGQYTVNFPNSGIGAGWTVQASAFGGNGAKHCRINGWSAGSVDVICFGNLGAVADSQFTVLAVAMTNDKNLVFALADQFGTPSYTPDPTDAYSTAGPIGITRSATGQYQVTFSGLVVTTPTVMVTGYGNGNAICQELLFSQNGSDFTVPVTCVSPAGVPTDSQFTVTVDRASPSGIGWAVADNPTTPAYSVPNVAAYNPGGGAINVTRASAGLYTITFNGLNAIQATGGNVRAQARATLTETCKAVSFDTSTANVTVGVSCSDANGAATDARFIVQIIAPVSGTPGGIAVNGGSTQSAPVTGAFATPLSVRVVDGNAQAVPNVTVTFTAPGSGASGTFPGASLTALATTNSSGVATAPTFTANGTVGPYSVTASVVGIGPTATFFLNNTAATSITLTTSPANLLVSLDGGAFTAAPLVALLVPGSVHTIAAQSPQSTGAGTQRVWQNWSDSGALSHDFEVPGSTTTYTATFGLQYQLTISASPAAGGTVTPASGTFYDAGTLAPITATANGGYAFTGWSGAVASTGNPSTTVTMSAPQTVVANFLQTSAITIQTSPTGLQFTVDGGAPQTAPQTLNLTQGSHSIAVVSTQAGPAGTRYVFTNWSNAVGTASQIINVSFGATYTATFKTQYQLTISASPAAGGTFTPATGTFVDAGTATAITATPNAGYAFTGWTGNVAAAGSASTTVTANSPQTLVANFALSTAITIQTNPAALTIVVDGVSWLAPQTLNLAQGTHTIAVATTQAGNPGQQYVFTGWSDSGPATHTISVGASVATYTATFTTQYQLTISASPSTGGTVTPATGAFYDSGTLTPITATANAGFAFSGWSGSGVTAPGSASTTVAMNSARTVTANFAATSGITIQTSPAGLAFTVDGGPGQIAPQTLSLSQGSHTIAVVGTQAGPAGTQYVFTGWSDSGAASHSITVGAGAASYTATFKTQFQLTMAASPVAGGTVTPATGTFYDSGTVVPVNATANAGYSFGSWTGGVASASSASTSVTMSAARTVTANFLSFTGTTIQTSPGGLQFTVDGGAALTAPQTLSLSQGSHTIAVVGTQAGGAGTQYVFTGWSDSGAASHAITVGAVAASYTATFKTQYQLTMAASPVAGGTVTPVSGTFYDAGTSVPVVATAGAGYQFSAWTGGVASASSASTTITMNAPATVTGNFTLVQVTSGLRFVPVTPCRIMDTRGANGTFSGPIIAAGGTRTVPVPSSVCGIPATAQAYSLNITVVPPGPLTYLTIWPAGQAQPNVSTLNSFDGRIVANAAIVPAGSSGAVNVFTNDASHVIIDINGYFAPASTAGSMAFYAATPCRVADTRFGSGQFGSPFMAGGSTRNFTIPASACGIPATAQAYSVNMTVVPRGALGYLTTWPTGQPQPVVSTLNSYDGSVVANAAIVPAGAGGAISVFVTDNTDLIIDVNGYFAPAGSAGALSLYTLTPCRVVDTRFGGAPFGGPILPAAGTRSFPVPTSGCSVPAAAQAYSMNVTVVPPGPLTYLTAWPTGQVQPVVSTLNSLAGKVVANAAIVPAGTAGGASIYVSDASHVILDINAYFAQ